MRSNDNILAIVIAFVLCLGAGLSVGCADLQTSEGRKLLIQDAIDIVIIRSDNRSAEASRIYKNASDVNYLASAASDTATLRQLILQYALKLPAGKDRDTAIIVSQIFLRRLDAYLGTIPLPGDKLNYAKAFISEISNYAMEESKLFIVGPLPTTRTAFVPLTPINRKGPYELDS